MVGSGTRKRWQLAAVGGAGQGEREEENRKAAGSTHGGQRRRLGGWPEKAAMGSAACRRRRRQADLMQGGAGSRRGSSRHARSLGVGRGAQRIGRMGKKTRKETITLAQRDIGSIYAPWCTSRLGFSPEKSDFFLFLVDCLVPLVHRLD